MAERLLGMKFMFSCHKWHGVAKRSHFGKGWLPGAGAWPEFVDVVNVLDKLVIVMVFADPHRPWSGHGDTEKQ